MHIRAFSRHLTLAAGIAIVLGGCAQRSATLPSVGPVSVLRTATTAATTSANPTHVLTSSRLAYDGSSMNYAWSAYQPYLSWVQTDPQYAAGATLAGVKPYWYGNPNRQPIGGIMYSSDETTFAHDCQGNRITDTQSPLYLMNPASAKLAQLWLTVSQNMLARFPYAAVFEDDTDDIYATSAAPCNFSPTIWLSSSIAEASVLTNAHIPVIYNALTFTGPDEAVSPAIAMNQVAIGGMMEGCYLRPSTTAPVRSGEAWLAAQNTELQMARQAKLFFCYADDYYATADQVIPYRGYAYASFLLSYDPGTSVYETNFVNKDDFNVMPESGVVALQPLKTTPLYAAGLLTWSGAYGREYAACYVRGQYVGKCAAAVNIDPVNKHAFPFSGYSHTMALSGTDVLSGGTVSETGPPPPGNMAPTSGIVAFQ